MKINEKHEKNITFKFIQTAQSNQSIQISYLDLYDIKAYNKLSS